MLKNIGTHSSGGDMPSSLRVKVDSIITELDNYIEMEMIRRNLLRAVVRPNLQANLLIILDSENIYVCGQPHPGMPTVLHIHKPTGKFSAAQILQAGRWEFGYEQPYVVGIPASLMNIDTDSRKPSLQATAYQIVEAEQRRVEMLQNIVQVRPIFGPAQYQVDQRLVFVLMPFKPELTQIYDGIVKPSAEEHGMVCRRADDYQTNKAVIQDIWKAICEAHVIIADLTGFNPNVMYELGVAHTVGKDTILIHQVGDSIEQKFPFDLAHIRRIEYRNDAIGGQNLKRTLGKTLESILKPAVIT